MKNFLLPFFAAFTVISSAAATISDNTSILTPSEKKFPHATQLQQKGMVCENPPKKDNVTYYDVKFNFVYDSDACTPAIMQYVMPVDGSFPYVGLCFGSDTSFSVPTGEYDLLSIFVSNNDEGCIVVVKENVEIKGDSEFTFDTSEATHHIIYSPVMPDGTEMKLPEWDSVQEKFVSEGNVDVSNAVIRIDHRGWGNIYTNSVIGLASPIPNTNVYTNAKEAFSFSVHVEGVAADYSECYVAWLEPSGCESQVVRNNPDQYTEFSPNFANALVSKNDKIDVWSSGVKVRVQTAYPNDDNYDNNAFMVSSCNPKGYICLPNHVNNFGKQYDVYYTLERAMGSYDNNFNFGINPPAISADEAGDKRCNVSHFNCMAWGMNSISTDLFNYVFQESGSKPYLIPNETFSYPYSDDMVFGNSCPLWIPSWDGSKLHYAFIGRLGDVRSVDMVNHHISVKSNDKELVSGVEELIASYGKINGVDKESPLDVHIENRNLKIDNTKRIRGVADLHIASGEDNTTIPVIQMLQFRNAENEPTDRFAPEGSRMLVAAGTFTNGGMCFKVSELSQFSAEYCLSGSDSYEMLPVTKGEEMDTYGWLYSADMDAVSSKEDGWYDLRLTATSANGSKMTQVISPAFRLDRTLGINVVDNDAYFNVTVVGRDIISPCDAEVYSVSGVRCSGKSLNPGIYIVRLGDKVKKVTIR